MTFGPSRTSQAVALTRAELDRPHSPDGNPDAQRALCAGIEFSPPAWLRPSIEARTRFMDNHVAAAIAAGVRQVVICGAGLDDRALRFRTPGVSFFEVDHPVTQADKAARLDAMGIGPPGPMLVSCDFQADEAGPALAAAGHSGSDATLFLCEGLLVYLDRHTCQRLLAGLGARAAAGSALAATLATHDSDVPAEVVVADANRRRRSGTSEPWRTILRAEEHLALVENAGWQVTEVADSPSVRDDVSYGRKSLLVTAVPNSLSGS
jgi:methyltransferase (TIGR00027 family)